MRHCNHDTPTAVRLQAHSIRFDIGLTLEERKREPEGSLRPLALDGDVELHRRAVRELLLLLGRELLQFGHEVRQGLAGLESKERLDRLDRGHFGHLTLLIPYLEIVI